LVLLSCLASGFGEILVGFRSGFRGKPIIIVFLVPPGKQRRREPFSTVARVAPYPLG